MSTSSLLKQEIVRPENAIFAPHYFKYLGYRKDYSLSRTAARAQAIEALFTLPEAFLYQNDWIAGSIRPLFVTLPETEEKHAKNICQSFGERDFAHNADHYSPNYAHILEGGLPALFEKIEASEQAHKDAEETEFLSAMKKSLTALKSRLLMHAEKARSLKSTKGYNNEKLGFIEENCTAAATRAPETFAEALQLIWMIHTCFLFEGRYAMALGRMDQYLYPFYLRDKQAGTLTDEFATELFENVFMKIYERRAFLGCDDVNNICIGGSDVNGNHTVNELSYCVLHAVKNVQIPGPNLSARIAENTPDEFLDECLQVIGTGLGYPALMNDKINIAALSRYGYDKEDVYNYSMVGCIENFITGKQPPWSDGRFDTPRYFEFLFNRGKGIKTPTFGVDTGDVKDIRSMDEFMEKFETQIRFGVGEYYALYRNENSQLNPKEYKQPFLSCFADDCIERAKDITDGGTKYPSVHGAGLMGVGTVADSLAAIEKTVFVDKTATLEEIRNAILNDFIGYEDLRQTLLDAPKYGNNDPFVDKYAVWHLKFQADEFSKYKTVDGGGLYVAVASNVNNIYAGYTIAATPDGRKAGEPLSDAASPTYGRDKKGATQTVNSITKPDYTLAACGTVVNQKFSPSMFEGEKRKKLLALVKVYMQKGGQEMQINATSRETLKDAMEHPEKYQNLVVRVSGFSALYVTLARDVQLDILNRTQQS